MPLVRSQVEHPRNLEPQPVGHLIEDFAPALAAAVSALHRVEHHGAVLVEAHPVVREHRIRFWRLDCVLHDTDAHPVPD